MSETMKLAVPTLGAAGLEGERSGHFGHCDCFTIVDIDDGEIKGASSVDCPEHVEGGCLRPVNALAEVGVTAIVAAGMGMRPLMGFNQVGIAVLYDTTEPNVGKVAEMVAQGRVPIMTPDSACNHHH